MKVTKFLNIDIEPAPPELELEIEMQCREIWACDDVKQVKAFCIDMMKNHARTEAVLSKAMMKVIELEATLVVLQTRTKRSTGIYKLRWWMEQLYMHWKYRKITKRYSHRA